MNHNQLLEQVYSLMKEESNPDAQADAKLKETFKRILRSYEVRERVDDIANELFQVVQVHIKATIPGQS